MKRISYKIIVLVFACVLSANAQQKLQKISQSINVEDDVTIDLNTSFTDIELETWNKDVIEIDAFIESDKLNKEELKKALKEWDINVEGSGNKVTISTKGTSSSWAWTSIADDDGGFNLVLEDMPEFPEMPELPELPELPEMPELPVVPELPEALQNIRAPEFPKLPELPKGVHTIDFDTDEYKKRGESYLNEWSDKFAAKYGSDYKEKMMDWGREFGNSDFEAKMRAWGEEFGKEFGEKFGKEMETWGEKFGESWGKDVEEKMQKWGEEFGEKWGDDYAKRMEVWSESLDKKLTEKYGEDYERELEKRAERIAKRAEGRAKLIEERMNKREGLFEERSNLKVKKILKIKMPKKAKLKVNVRHGELKFSSVIHNLKADLSHSKLVANSIDGSSTSINASYTKVNVDDWLQGDLKLNYVEDANLGSVNRLVLTSNSSNININALLQNAIIDGSFGDLVIRKIDDDFSNLNILLENSDAVIKLPNSDYDLLFKGNRSMCNDELTDKKVIKNYPEGSISNKTIVVNAKFSKVTMQ